MPVELSRLRHILLGLRRHLPVVFASRNAARPKFLARNVVFGRAVCFTFAVVRHGIAPDLALKRPRPDDREYQRGAGGSGSKALGSKALGSMALAVAGSPWRLSPSRSSGTRTNASAVKVAETMTSGVRLL